MKVLFDSVAALRGVNPVRRLLITGIALAALIPCALTAQATEAIYVSAEVLKVYVGKYDLVHPPGHQPPPGLPPIDVAADAQGLFVTFSARVRYLPISETEFFNATDPKEHLRFSKDAQGKVTGFTVSGLDTSLGGPTELKATRLP